MSAMLEVVQPGFGTTLQDAGRAGMRHYGLPLTGWLDAPLAEAANVLVGNGALETVLELRGAGTVLRVANGPVRLALSGQVSAARVTMEGVRTPLASWQSTTLVTGDVLQIGSAASGCAYLAVAGGLLVPAAFGSRSSYWRAGLAGLLGRPLQAGDQLPCGVVQLGDQRQRRSGAPWPQSDRPIRVLLGPQDDHFTSEALRQFLDEAWEATSAQDRMGIRLRGTALQHVSQAAAEIVSDGVAPGAVQVPANGMPIILLADGQTVGGYPKIATVIVADLPRLAHIRPGAAVRFCSVTPTEAKQALLAQQAQRDAWAQKVEFFLPPGVLDEAALYQSNLISGMLAAQPEEHPL